MHLLDEFFFTPLQVFLSVAYSLMSTASIILFLLTWRLMMNFIMSNTKCCLRQPETPHFFKDLSLCKHTVPTVVLDLALWHAIITYVNKFFPFNLAQFHLPKPTGSDPVKLVMRVDWPIIPTNTSPCCLVPSSSYLFCERIDIDSLFFNSLSLVTWR